MATKPPFLLRIHLPGQAARLDRRATRQAIGRAAGLGAVLALPDLPEPQTFGDVVRARQILAGRIRLGGQAIALPDGSLWDALTDPAAMAEAQGFAWLDDLAALGDARARGLARTWADDWITRFATARPASARFIRLRPGSVGVRGWSVAETGPRLLRLIDHAGFLTLGRDSTPLVQAIAAQALFLDRRAETVPAGPTRLIARAALIRAALLLPALGITPPCDALAIDCTLAFDQQGATVNRNPEGLLDLFALLIGTARVLAEADLTPPPPLLAVIARFAPLLRSLRHADAGLPRFHGGDRGTTGRLDTALAASGIRTRAEGGLAMGYARLSAGRTSVILDAAPPPPGSDAQASTLAFEMTSGRRPLIVSCGPGAAFGAASAHAARATSCHSTLCLEGHSSAHTPRGAHAVTSQPTRVICEASTSGDGLRMDCIQDGWTQSHGLTHARTLTLSSDGRSLLGEDVLAALDAAGRATFDRVTAGQGAEFTLRFHLHPDVVAIPDDDGLALVLRSGEVWLFRHDGTSTLALAPSVYFDTTRLAPRPAQQVVLSGRAMSYAVSVGWSITKARETPQGLRDLASDDGAEDSEGPDR